MYLSEVLAGVRATRLLAGRSGLDRLNGVLQEVAELERLNEVAAQDVSGYLL
jgi:hypothetical protein